MDKFELNGLDKGDDLKRKSVQFYMKKDDRFKNALF